MAEDDKTIRNPLVDAKIADTLRNIFLREVGLDPEEPDPPPGLEDPFLGQLAVDEKLITPRQLQAALNEQKNRQTAGDRILLGQMLQELGFIEPEVFEPFLRKFRMLSAFQRYVVRRKLGEGGMAEVFQAHDLELGRTVALKILKEARGNVSTLRRRFERESRAVARLSHPQVVSVFDAGEQDGLMYLVMEYVDGATLEEEIRELTEDRIRACELMEKVAKAVHHAHEAGIVHRDLKPGNILLTSGGEPKVSDFGLAHLIDEKAQITQSGDAMGTPMYMAPEQVQGRKGTITPRTDVYALGAILYRLLTGNAPHSGSSVAELYAKILSSDPALPREADSTIPKDLENIVLKAMERDPRRRYGSAAAFGEDLRRWRVGEPISAHPPSRLYRMKKALVRRKGIVVASVAGALAVGLTLAVLLPQWNRQKRETDRIHEREAAMRRFAGLSSEFVAAELGRRDRVKDAATVRADMRFAVRRVTGFIEDHPRLPQGYYLRARGRLFLNDLEGAEDDVHHALSLDADFQPAWALKAVLNLERHTRSQYVQLAERIEPAAPGRYLQKARESLRKVGDNPDFSRWGLGRTEELEVWHTLILALGEYHLEGSHDGARQRLREADAGRPSEEYCRQLCYWSTDAADAEKWIDRAIEIAPRYVWLYLDRALVRMRLGRMKDALFDFDEAVRMDPEFVVARETRGACHEKLGNREEARVDYTRALELQPDRKWTLYNRGRLLTEMGQSSKGIADLSRAIELDEGNVLFRVTRSWSLIEEGRPRDALKDAEEAIQLESTSAMAWFRKGQAFMALGQLGDALAAYDRAIEIEALPEAFHNRGMLHLGRKDYRKAEEDLTRAIEGNDGLIRAIYNRGYVRSRRDDVAGAVRDWLRVVDLDPGHFDAWYNLGAVRHRLERHEEAEAAFTRAVELRPEHTDSYTNRGVSRNRLRRFEAAVQDFTMAIRLSGRGMDYYYRAVCLSALDRPAEAILDLQAALRRLPADDVRRIREAKALLSKLEN